jgi:hypothetical protein
VKALQKRLGEQERVLNETNVRLEEREKMVCDLTELNDMNRLLITRCHEYENFEADFDDEENSRYTGRIEQFEQQLNDLHREYGLWAPQHATRS